MLETSVPCRLLALLLAASAVPARSQDPPPALEPSAFDAMVARIERWHADGLIVGAEFLVLQRGATLRHEVVGFRDREDGRPMEKETIFNLRSMTKALTGAAAQILIDAGALALDDPVAKYLPGFDTDDARAITIEQLLTHRSGLPLTILQGTRDYESLLDMANAVGTRGPQFEPGERFWYSDSGTDVLGAVIATVAGKPLDVFVTERLLEPLGMRDSFYGTTDGDDPRAARIASLYVGRPRSWVRFWQPGGEPFYPFAWGSQTLYGTPRDFARFLALWMHGGRVGERRILSEEAMRRTTTPVSRMTSLGSGTPMPTMFPGYAVYYGQMCSLRAPAAEGIPERAPVWGHSGSDGTIGWAFPAHDLIVLYFTQSRGQLTPLRLERDLARLLFPPDERPIPAAHVPLLGLYHGALGAEGEQTVEILSEGGTLFVDIPLQLLFELREPDAEGRWRFVLTDEVSVSFRRTGPERATHLEFRQGPGTYVLERVEAPPPPRTVRSVTRAEVARFLGRYRDERNDEVVTLAFEDGKLVARAPSVPIPLAFAPPEREGGRWTLGIDPAVTLDFQVDEAGKVVSYTAYRGESSSVRLRLTDGG